MVTPMAAATGLSLRPSPPGDPRLARTETEARLVLRAFYAEAARALRTNDTSSYDALVSDSCNCRKGIHAAVERNRARNAHATHGEVSIRSLKFEQVSLNFVGVTVTYDQAPGEIVTIAAKPLGRDPGARGVVDLVVLSNASGTTLVTGVQGISKGQSP